MSAPETLERADARIGFSEPQNIVIFRSNQVTWRVPFWRDDHNFGGL
jgi:hypothetical protein